MNTFIPRDGERCWAADPASISMAGKTTFWASAMWHKEMLKRGLLFPCRKQAVAACKRMLSQMDETNTAGGGKEEETNDG